MINNHNNQLKNKNILNKITREINIRCNLLFKIQKLRENSKN